MKFADRVKRSEVRALRGLKIRAWRGSEASVRIKSRAAHEWRYHEPRTSEDCMRVKAVREWRYCKPRVIPSLAWVKVSRAAHEWRMNRARGGGGVWSHARSCGAKFCEFKILKRICENRELWFCIFKRQTMIEVSKIGWRFAIWVSTPVTKKVRWQQSLESINQWFKKF